MIEVQNLSKKFDSRGIAGVHSLNLSISEGTVFALMGPNGSGKTTLLRMLAGTLPPDSGTVNLKGPVTSFPSEEILPTLNVQKYLMNAVTLPMEEEKKLQLTRDLADTFEFTFQLRQSLPELSTGQRQRVLLARELINSPALLLLDEPFAHLDPFMRKDILESLFRYIRQKEITVLWVTHDLDEALRFSHTLGILNFGRLEQIGIPQDFIQRPKNLFVAQFVGYKNFFPVSYQEGHWIGPWGSLDLPALEKSEGLLVVPDKSWKAGEGVTFKITERYPASQSVHYIIENEGKLFHMDRGPTEELSPVGSTIALSPDPKAIFIIPL